MALKAALASEAGVAIAQITLTVSPSEDGKSNPLLFVITVADATTMSSVASRLTASMSSAANASRVFNVVVLSKPSLVAAAGSNDVVTSAQTGVTTESSGGVVIALAAVVAVLGVIFVFVWRRTRGALTTAQPMTRRFESQSSEITISRTACNSYAVNEMPYGYNLDRNSAAKTDDPPPFDKL